MVSRLRTLSGKDPGISGGAAADLKGTRFDVLEAEGTQSVADPTGIVGEALHERAPLVARQTETVIPPLGSAQRHVGIVCACKPAAHGRLQILRPLMQGHLDPY